MENNNEELLKYASVISAAVFGVILLGYFVYVLMTSKGTKKYKSSQSLDTLYDEAGGNDPLSDARLTSSIDISTDEYSCKFDVLYEGIKGRKVRCIGGCNSNDPKDKENKDFCEKFVYLGKGNTDNGELSDTLLDDTYVNRRDSSDE